MKVAIIGAGAAGLFTAINIKQFSPEIEVVIYESSSRELNKVRLSGGGRCNLTNSFEDVKSLASVYPRGEHLMKRLFKIFNHEDTYSWFEDRGVKLVTQDDQCVFPESQNAMEVVSTLLREAREEEVDIQLRHGVESITKNEDKFEISFDNRFGERPNDHPDVVVVTCGGFPSDSGYDFLSKLSLELIKPIPSLFTFSVDNRSLSMLMGAVAPNAMISIQGTKFKSDGPLLVTHWGLSGPSILKLSSYAAPWLKENDYKCNIAVTWIGLKDENLVRDNLKDTFNKESKKMLANIHPFDLSTKLWNYILNKKGIDPNIRCAEIGNKLINSIIQGLTNDEYLVSGRYKYKDEFVTCGGVSLKDINPSTLEAKNIKNLYFAGEVLDIDAITGGFNLQAAWTTGYVVAQSISAI